MANGKITKELKELGLKINGVEPKGNTTSELIKGIADDYTGGGSSGGSTAYKHYVKVNAMDTCSQESEQLLIVINDNDTPITLETLKSFIATKGYTLDAEYGYKLTDNCIHIDSRDYFPSYVIYDVDGDTFKLGNFDSGNWVTIESVISDTIKQ